MSSQNRAPMHGRPTAAAREAAQEPHREIYINGVPSSEVANNAKRFDLAMAYGRADAQLSVPNCPDAAAQMVARAEALNAWTLEARLLAEKYGEGR